MRGGRKQKNKSVVPDGTEAERVYPKNEQDDLTADQVKLLRKALEI